MYIQLSPEAVQSLNRSIEFQTPWRICRAR